VERSELVLQLLLIRCFLLLQLLLPW
jgi:hypothetical protein